MTTISAYLNFPGNCEDAFNFYKSVFGGEFQSFNRFSEMPPQERMPISDDFKNKIMHISLPVSEECVLMGSDSGGEWAPDLTLGNNISLSITANSKEEADRLFIRLAEGGKVTMPMEETFWGEYFGMCSDQFGIHWMISFRHIEKS